MGWLHGFPVFFRNTCDDGGDVPHGSPPPAILSTVSTAGRGHAVILGTISCCIGASAAAYNVVRCSHVYRVSAKRVGHPSEGQTAVETLKTSQQQQYSSRTSAGSPLRTRVCVDLHVGHYVMYTSLLKSPWRSDQGIHMLATRRQDVCPVRCCCTW